jgi:hypothetical protein
VSPPGFLVSLLVIRSPVASIVARCSGDRP